MKYSKSTNGFYLEGFSEIELPADCVEISDTLYADMMQGQSNGKRIICGADGLPCLVDQEIQLEPPKVT